MNVAVYASSSDTVDARFRAAAQAVGRALGERGDELVYGGTAQGLMGVVATAVREAGGRVTGVLPQVLVDRGLADERCDALVVTDDMAGRKREMMARADAFVALPGGFGTLEELFEALTSKQLGAHDRAVALLDVDGFFDPLTALFEHLYTLRFADRAYAALYHVAPDVPALLAHLDGYEPTRVPPRRS